VKVSTTPNMALLSVQETACLKRKLDPTKHALEHRGKRLDVSSTVRFSGLPNNVLLELVELSSEEVLAACNKTEEVTVCLQLTEGDRLVDTFPSSVSLGGVVARWTGQLGPEPEEGEQPVVVYMRKEVIGQSELDITTLRSLGLTCGKGLFRFFFKKPDILKNQANVYNIKEKEGTPVEERRHLPMRSDAEMVSKETGQTESTISEVPDIVSGENKSDKIQVSRVPSEQNIQIDDSSKEDKSVGQRDISPNPQPDSSTDEIEPIILPIGPNGAVVFMADGPVGAPTAQIDDEFFKLSLDEVKGLYRDLKQDVKKLDEGEMLMTKQMREGSKDADRLSVMSRYKTGVLRIQFPSRHLVQGQFSPSTTVREVMEWLKSFLLHPSAPFELYTAPPRVVLPLQESLLDLGLFPAALIHFSTSLTTRELIESGQYLNQDVLDSLSNISGANKAAADARSAGKRVGKGGQHGIQGDLDVYARPYKRKLDPVTEETQSTSGSSSQSSGGQKLPKWFKTNK